VTDIFVSYASEDRSIVEALAANLGVDGWKIFWDRRIGAGANWNEEIQRELHDAHCVLVLWSEVSKNSFWVAAKRPTPSIGTPMFRCGLTSQSHRGYSAKRKRSRSPSGSNKRIPTSWTN
jgi:hypothetical protein